MHDFYISDSSFVFNGSTKYDLSIQAGLDGFSFSVTEAPGHVVRCFGYQAFSLSNTNVLVRKIREIADGLPLLDNVFNTVTLFVAGSNFTLLPQALFSEKLAATWLKPSEKEKLEKKTLFTQPVGSINAMLSFMAGNQLVAYFHDRFPEPIVSHELVAILDAVAGDKELPPDRIHIHLHSGYFYLVAMKNGSLLLANSFMVSTTDDCIFYIASVIRALGGPRIPLVVSGDTAVDDPVYRAFEKNFPGTSIWDFSPGVSFGIPWNDQPLHRFIPHFIKR